jgi:restriction system protein
MKDHTFKISATIFTLVFLCVIFLYALLDGKIGAALFPALLALPCGIHLRRLIRESSEMKSARALELCDIDTMNGIQFERFVAKLFQSQGYAIEFTPATGDLGIDLIAFRDGKRCAVQCKRQSAQVSRRAVSDAVAGRSHYDCNEAMVVTNAHFTKGARILANSTGCRLIDRKDLSQWIIDFQAEAPVKNRTHMNVDRMTGMSPVPSLESVSRIKLR